MINDMEVRKRVDAFVAKHGDHVTKNYCIYHEDGATRDVNRLGPLAEPPVNAMLRHNNILTYRKVKLERAVLEFDELKAKLEDNPHAGDGLKTNVRRLKALKAAVHAWQCQVKEAETLLDQVMPGYQPPERLAEIAAQDEAMEKGREAVREIKI